jgi:hypothetical protein
MPGRTCNQCRETLDRIQAVVDKGVQRPPENELEHRVEHYAARAEQGLPLFDETRPIDWELV